MVATVVQTLNASITTVAKIHTATGDEKLVVRITNDTTGVAKIKLGVSTTEAHQASGKLLPDDFEIAANTTFVEKIFMKTANEFLVLESDVAVTANVSGVKL